jgi:hypothetical protein
VLTRRSSRSVGVRAAIHQVLKKEGVDPVPLDPWYFPTAAQYTSVSAVGHVQAMCIVLNLQCVTPSPLLSPPRPLIFRLPLSPPVPLRFLSRSSAPPSHLFASRPASCVLRPASCVLRPASCVLPPADFTLIFRSLRISGHLAASPPR